MLQSAITRSLFRRYYITRPFEQNCAGRQMSFIELPGLMSARDQFSCGEADIAQAGEADAHGAHRPPRPLGQAVCVITVKATSTGPLFLLLMANHADYAERRRAA